MKLVVLLSGDTIKCQNNPKCVLFLKVKLANSFKQLLTLGRNCSALAIYRHQNVFGRICSGLGESPRLFAVKVRGENTVNEAEKEV